MMEKENKKSFIIILFFVGYLGYIYFTHDKEVIKWNKCNQEV